MGRFGAPSGNDLLLRWRDVEDCPRSATTWTIWWPMAIWPVTSPSMRMSAVSSLTVALHIGPPLRFAFSVVENGTRYPCRRAL